MQDLTCGPALTARRARLAARPRPRRFGMLTRTSTDGPPRHKQWGSRVEIIDGGVVLATGFALTELSGFEVWARYVRHGGAMTRLSFGNYLSGDEQWPVIEHDIARYVINAELRERGIGFVVASAAEIVPPAE